MFYEFHLLRRGGKFGVVWIVATRGIRCVTDSEIKSVNVVNICDDILSFMVSASNRPTQRFSLSLSAKLIHGVIRIQQRHAEKLFQDIFRYLTTIKKPLFLSRSGEVSDDDYFKTPDTKIKKKKAPKKKAVVQSDDSDLVPQAPVILQAAVVQDLERSYRDALAHVRDITMAEPDVPKITEPRETDFGIETDIQFIREIMGPDLMNVTRETEIRVMEQQVPPTAVVPQIAALEDIIEVARPPDVHPEIIIQETVPEKQTVVEATPAKRSPPTFARRLVKKPQSDLYDIVMTRKKKIAIDRGFEMIENMECKEMEDDCIQDILSFIRKHSITLVTHIDRPREIPQKKKVTEPQMSYLQPPEPIQSTLQRGPTPLRDIGSAVTSVGVSISDIPPIETSAVAPSRDISFHPNVESTPLIQVLQPEQPPSSPMKGLIEDEVLIQPPQIRLPIADPEATQQEKLKAIVHYVQDCHRINKIPVTLEDIADKPLTRPTVAVAFNNLLVLHKMQYLELVPRENSIELSHIKLGRRSM